MALWLAANNESNGVNGWPGGHLAAVAQLGVISVAAGG